VPVIFSVRLAGSQAARRNDRGFPGSIVLRQREDSE
jgi:hypothetical protein